MGFGVLAVIINRNWNFDHVSGNILELIWNEFVRRDRGGIFLVLEIDDESDGIGNRAACEFEAVTNFHHARNLLELSPRLVVQASKLLLTHGGWHLLILAVPDSIIG